MKTYTEIKQYTNSVPAWYTPEIHKKVCGLLESGQKLLAVKYLCDESTANGTRSEFGLREAKDLCDDINPPMFRVPAPNMIPVSVQQENVDSETLVEDVAEAILHYKDVTKADLKKLLAYVPDNVLQELLDSLDQ